MEIITKDMIQLDVDLEGKEAVINHLVNLMNQHDRITDKEKLIEDIYLREEETSTSMGLSVALPHAKSAAVIKPSVVFLRLKNKINWDTDDNIMMVFGIFIPVKNTDNEHLKILAQLARKLMDPEFREKLLNTKSKANCKLLLDSLNKTITNEEVTATVLNEEKRG
ncbi:PTS sugar transporter subunit IIA [Alkalibacterium putridalgicola]|uniref:PTS sugar transporter subunit IIA n=1 Tax=Alkalibacterium putridalgicola TaxID=426703 RepID=UPI0034CEFE29